MCCNRAGENTFAASPMYQAHPSRELASHFARRPFQGAEPSVATFLFVGLDANYDASIERSPLFQSVLEYHQDGVAFWRRHGVHHPFLLSQYTGDGRRYHRNFARIGFTSQHAHHVSFVELLHLPTVGRNKLAPEDLDHLHLRMVNSAILSGQARHIFISAGVVRLMRASGAFPWLSGRTASSGPLPVLYRQAHRAVYLHLHLSNYGKFQRQLEAEATAIGTLVARGG
jgi:hypothetical protein